MEIVWALPDYTTPKTGAEKLYKALKNELNVNSITIATPRTYTFTSNNAFISNVRNLLALYKCSKSAYIFQDFSHRKHFLITNLILTFILNRKIVIFVHEQFNIETKSLITGCFMRAINFILFSCAKVIVVNSRSTGEWINTFGNFAKKTIKMYPVINKSKGFNIRNQNNQKLLKRKANEINILCVANIRRNKGQIVLLEALKILKNINISICFAGIIKEEIYFDELNKFVGANNMGKQILFAGYLENEELEKAYKEADIFVLPTLKEGFGMVLIEAMAYGLPVIASNVGGIPEVVEHGKNGLLVPPKDPHKLAEAIKTLIEDNGLYERLSKNALNRCETMPQWEVSVKELLRKISI